MKTIEINIPDMQSSHCQTRVNNAVKTMEGVKIEKVEAGKLAVSLENESLESEVVKAIEKAGYTVDQGKESSTKDNNSSSCSTGCCGN